MFELFIIYILVGISFKSKLYNDEIFKYEDLIIIKLVNEYRHCVLVLS